MSNLPVDRLLSSLEEYLSIKKEIVNGDTSDLTRLKDSKKRIESCLSEYFNINFDKAILEERRRLSSTTRKVTIISEVSWEDVVKLLDVLNNAPSPMNHISNIEDVKHWMNVYQEWFNRKKKDSTLKSLEQPLELEI